MHPAIPAHRRCARRQARRLCRQRPEFIWSRIMNVLSALSAAALAVAAAPSFAAGGSAFPPGVYRCELNQSVHVRTVSQDLKSAVIHWAKKDYTLQSVGTRSGALRFEDAASGLVWIMIPGKSMLLDSRKGQRLADECRA
jgi:hypothetical protein